MSSLRSVRFLGALLSPSPTTWAAVAARVDLESERVCQGNTACVIPLNDLSGLLLRVAKLELSWGAGDGSPLRVVEKAERFIERFVNNGVGFEIPLVNVRLREDRLLAEMLESVRDSSPFGRFLLTNPGMYDACTAHLSLMENAEYGTMFNLLAEWPAPGMIPVETVRRMLFRVIFSLASLQAAFPGARHNDLHGNNVFVHAVVPWPNRGTIYDLPNGSAFVLQVDEFDPRIGDFDMISLPRVCASGKATAPEGRRWNISEDPDDGYDLFTVVFDAWTALKMAVDRKEAQGTVVRTQPRRCVMGLDVGASYAPLSDFLRDLIPLGCRHPGSPRVLEGRLLDRNYACASIQTPLLALEHPFFAPMRFDPARHGDMKLTGMAVPRRALP